MIRAKYLLAENMFLFFMSVWRVLHQPGCSFNICCSFSIRERINAAVFCCVKKAFSHSSSMRKARATVITREEHLASTKKYCSVCLLWVDRQILWTNCRYCEDKLCSCRRYPYCWLHRFLQLPLEGSCRCPSYSYSQNSGMNPIVCQSALP